MNYKNPVLEPIAAWVPTGPLTTGVLILVFGRIQQGGQKMAVRIATTVRNIEKNVSNPENAQIIFRFFEFMKRIGTSEGYQNNNLKTITAYSKFLDPSIKLQQIRSKSQITSFLDTKMKAI